MEIVGPLINMQEIIKNIRFVQVNLLCPEKNSIQLRPLQGKQVTEARGVCCPRFYFAMIEAD